jgi:hypothetical protein
MVGIDWKKIATVFRRRGLGAAALTALGGVGLAVADQATTRFVPAISDYISDILVHPAFSVALSEPSEVTDVSLRAVNSNSEETPVEFDLQGPRLIVVHAGPGNYIIIVKRISVRGTEKLQQPIEVARGGVVKIAAEDSEWDLVANFERAGDAAGSKLTNTRWVTTAEEILYISQLPSGSLSRVLNAAFSEIGVQEFGSKEDAARIDQYWTGVKFDAPSTGIPWGSSFVSWAVEQGGVDSAKSASFNAWLSWGVSVPVKQAAPGMVAIYPAPGLAEASSGLLVGIILQGREGCTDIISGNLLNRVAITCVTGTPKDIRWIPS